MISSSSRQDLIILNPFLLISLSIILCLFVVFIAKKRPVPEVVFMIVAAPGVVRGIIYLTYNGGYLTNNSSDSPISNWINSERLLLGWRFQVAFGLMPTFYLSSILMLIAASIFALNRLGAKSSRGFGKAGLIVIAFLIPAYIYEEFMMIALALWQR